jgi:hypothetical protein
VAMETKKSPIGSTLGHGGPAIPSDLLAGGGAGNAWGCKVGIGLSRAGKIEQES